MMVVPLRDLLTWLAITSGLAAASAIALVITVYAMHSLLRLLRHFSISSPPPSLAEVAGFGLALKFVKAEEASESLLRTVEKQERQIKTLETNQLRMIAELEAMK